MFFINHIVQPKSHGGMPGSPDVFHLGASCTPCLGRGKFQGKGTNLLRESNLLTRDSSKDNTLSR